MLRLVAMLDRAFGPPFKNSGSAPGIPDKMILIENVTIANGYITTNTMMVVLLLIFTVMGLAHFYVITDDKSLMKPNLVKRPTGPHLNRSLMSSAPNYSGNS